MKVLFVANYLKGTGGISVQVESLADHLRKDGYEADICSTKGSIFYRLRTFGNLVLQAPKYDVIHVHACSGRGFLPAIVGISVAKLCHRRVVLTYHGGGAETFFSKHTSLVRFFLERTDYNIVLSGFIGSIFQKHQIPFKIIPNTIELDESVFRTREIIHPHFICIRSHTSTYNIPCILKAFEIVKEQLPDATLTLIGDGPLHDELKRMVQDAHLSDVSFVGRVDNKQIYSYLDGADVMLSSPIIDNMPMSLLEGFNAGLLVISSKVGGVPYMVENGENGLLFDSGDASQLADCMFAAVKDPIQTKEMIKNAHASLMQYSWGSIREQLLPLYFDIM